MRPLTLSAPKPLLPTAGVPFLAHQLAMAAECGITHVVLATSYRAEMFTEAFGDGAEFGLSIDYVYESEPLGTGGGIRNAAALLRPIDDAYEETVRVGSAKSVGVLDAVPTDFALMLPSCDEVLAL